MDVLKEDPAPTCIPVVNIAQLIEIHSGRTDDFVTGSSRQADGLSVTCPRAPYTSKIVPSGMSDWVSVSAAPGRQNMAVLFMMPPRDALPMISSRRVIVVVKEKNLPPFRAFASIA